MIPGNEVSDRTENVRTATNDETGNTTGTTDRRPCFSVTCVVP